MEVSKINGSLILPSKVIVQSRVVKYFERVPNKIISSSSLYFEYKFLIVSSIPLSIMKRCVKKNRTKLPPVFRVHNKRQHSRTEIGL